MSLLGHQRRSVSEVVENKNLQGYEMKRYIVFTGIVIGVTIMVAGASIVGAVSYIGDKLIGRE